MIDLNSNTYVTVWEWVPRLKFWRIERSYCLSYARQVIEHYRGERELYAFPHGWQME